MEKNVKRNSGFTIVFIFVIILLSVTIVMNYIVYKEKEKLNSESGTQEKNYNDKVKELETLNAEVQQEEEKIKDLENLDNAIKEVKKDYYSSIKTLEDAIISKKSDKKIAYLTFDDGPSENTQKILDILERKQDIKSINWRTGLRMLIE